MGAMERGTLIVVNVAVKTGGEINGRVTRKLHIIRLGIIVRSMRQNKCGKYYLTISRRRRGDYKTIFTEPKAK
jgi:hypothetical protein